MVHFVYGTRFCLKLSIYDLFLRCHMQSFTDATPTPTPCYRLREIVFSFCFLFVDFLFVFGFFLFFGIALGMFDMISGIALVNLTKNEQKKCESCRRCCCCWVLSIVKTTCRLLAPLTRSPSPFSPREQCQSQTSERSINFWQTTRKWNRKRKQNNAKKKKKRKEKITAQSGETRVSEIDGAAEGAGWGLREEGGLAQTLQLWLSWKSSVSGHGKHITLRGALLPPLVPSYPLFSLSFGGFYFI